MATRLARHLRRLTGQGFQPVVLAGQSLGASLVFAAANSDAALSPNDGDFSGLIPMDTIYALPPGAGATRTLFCQIEQSYRTALRGGSYSMNSIGGIQAGTYALADPDGHSLSATLTNREVALNQGAALTFLPALQFHTFSVWRDAGGRPIDGTFTRSAAMFLAMATFTPWRARATMIDYFAVPCATNDLPYDDHLSDITAPILYIGSAGGFGLEGLYILDLLGSDDITSVFVQLRADDQAWDDFGHLDWMAADDAPALVWQPIGDWISSRAQR